EPLAGDLELLELVSHLVEGCRELAELVLGVDPEAPAEVSGGDPAGGLLEPFDPDAERPGDERAGQQGEGEGDEAGDQDASADQRDVLEDVVEPDAEEGDLDDASVELDRHGDDADPAARAGQGSAD